MAITSIEFYLVCDFLWEVETATTDVSAELLICRENRGTYRKGLVGGVVKWVRPDVMLMSDYGGTDGNTVRNSDKLGGQSASAFEQALTFNSPLQRTINVVSAQVANSSQNGVLTSADWATFNNKQASLGFTPENAANKSTDVNADQTSNVKYPTVKAIYDWATTIFLIKNTAVTSATKTKITYDAKGLVTTGADATTADITENAGFLYFTAARVLATVLAGLSVATNSPIIATDSVLIAFGKLQAQITALATVARTGSYTDLINKPTIPAIVAWFKTGGSQTTPTKVWMDVVSGAGLTSSGLTIDISSAGFSAILGYQVIGIRNTGTITSSPQVSVKTISTTSLVVNITESSSNLVTVAGISVLGGLPTILASTSGLSVSVVVWGT